MFLTVDELKDMTGYQRHADQRRWLTDKGWTFEVSANGKPVVARSYAESRIGASHQSAPVWKPNLSAFKV